MKTALSLLRVWCLYSPAILAPKGPSASPYLLPPWDGQTNTLPVGVFPSSHPHFLQLQLLWTEVEITAMSHLSLSYLLMCFLYVRGNTLQAKQIGHDSHLTSVSVCMHVCVPYVFSAHRDQKRAVELRDWS